MLDLLARLPAFRRVPLGGWPVAGPAFQVGHVRQQVRQRAFVPFLPGALERLFEPVPGLVEAICLLQAHGESHRRPLQHPRRPRLPLQIQGLLAQLNGEAAAGQEVHVQLPHQRLPGQARVIYLPGQREPGLYMLCGTGQIQVAGDLEVDAGLQHPAAGGLSQCLVEHGARRRIALVIGKDVRQDQQCFGPIPPGRHLARQRLQVAPRPGGVAGPEQIAARVRPSPPPSREPIARGERGGELGQFRGRVGCASGGGRVRRLAQRRGHILIWAVAGQGKMTGPLFQVRGDLAQPAVHLPPAPGRRARIDRGSEQGVGEPDPGTIDLDHVMRGGRLERGQRPRATRLLQHHRRRRPQARDDQQGIASTCWQRGQPAAHHLLQMGRHRQRFLR